VRESAESAGAREVYLIEEPMAAAIGAGLPVTEARGSMIVDIGGGTTEVAIVSLKGIVHSQAARVGGDKMDEAIAQFIRRQHNVVIGEKTAEQIKMSIGRMFPSGEEEYVEVTGRDLLMGMPKAIVISESEIREALTEPVNQIVELVKIALERCPPELAADLLQNGIALAGGGALLPGLDRVISERTGMKAAVVKDPLSAVVIGSGAVLDQPELLREVVIQ
jgi:rod shape-determining protein MreB